MTKEELFNSKLDELQEKHSKLFADLEKEEEGAGNIRYHTVNTMFPQSDGVFKNIFSADPTSPLPDYLKDDIVSLWKSVFNSI